MQANNGGIIATIIICSVILLLAGLVAVNSVKNAIPEAPTIVIPTAAQIAAEIPGVDTSDLYDGIYRRQIRRLERQSLVASMDEFNIDGMDEIHDLLDDAYDDYDDFEFITEDFDDVEYDIIDLGLDDRDDREVIVTGVAKVRVFYDVSSPDNYEDAIERIYITSVVTVNYEGELEAELTYSLTQ